MTGHAEPGEAGKGAREGNGPRRRNWGQFAGPALGFAAGIATTSVTFISGVLDREVRERAVDVEVMRIAFDVLQLPKGQTGAGYRTWACEVLNAHTSPALDCAAEDVSSAVLSDLGRFDTFRVGDRDEGSPSATDIAVYICDEPDGIVARRAAAALRDAGFGDIAFRQWADFEEIPRSELSGAISIVYDADHPERDEVRRIETALSGLGVDRIEPRENTGGLSRWFISVIVCDVES